MASCCSKTAPAPVAMPVAAKTQSSYTPVIALFSAAGLMTLATSLGMTGFMGLSLGMLASLKLMDLNGFAKSFANYDLVTRRVKQYGKAYPFLELAIALGFLSGIAPLATGIGSLAVGLSGGASVVKAVYLDKKELTCACIGGNSKAPLGIVSFVENAMMAVMGAVLIGMAVMPQEVSPQAVGLNLNLSESAIAPLSARASSN